MNPDRPADDPATLPVTFGTQHSSTSPRSKSNLEPAIVTEATRNCDFGILRPRSLELLHDFAGSNLASQAFSALGPGLILSRLSCRASREASIPLVETEENVLTFDPTQGKRPRQKGHPAGRQAGRQGSAVGPASSWLAALAGSAIHTFSAGLCSKKRRTSFAAAAHFPRSLSYDEAASNWAELANYDGRSLQH